MTTKEKPKKKENIYRGVVKITKYYFAGTIAKNKEEARILLHRRTYSENPEENLKVYHIGEDDEESRDFDNEAEIIDSTIKLIRTSYIKTK